MFKLIFILIVITFTNGNILKSDKTLDIIQKCGYRNVNGAEQSNSSDDSVAKIGEFPWMLAVMKKETHDSKVSNVFQCGASLILPNVALTAAHCVYDKSVNELIVRVGELHSDQDYEVKDVVIHEKFYKNGLHNDIALLILTQQVQLNDNINTICLPPQNFNFDEQKCLVSGWGKKEFGRDSKYQETLKKIELPTVSFNNCEEFLRKTRLGRRFLLHDSFMCAGGEEGKDACKGDGGSPLICPIENRDGHYYQAGIVAWGVGCGNLDVPGVYVNVAKYRNWIDSKIQTYNFYEIL